MILWQAINTEPISYDADGNFMGDPNAPWQNGDSGAIINSPIDYEADKVN